MNCTAIILAGGESSRMGTDKGLLVFDSSAMIAHIIQTLEQLFFKDILIITNNEKYNAFGYPVFSDIYPKKGPLGGIYTGLINSKTHQNLILSCDIPFIESFVLNKLFKNTENNKITFVKHNQRNHYLIGLYYKNIITELEENILNNNLRLSDLIFNNSFKIIDLDKESPELDAQVTDNINSIQELKKYGYEL